MELTCDFYINVLNKNGIEISGGTIHDFLKNSCVIYNDEDDLFEIGYMNGKELTYIGGNYNIKPKLQIFQKIDFVYIKGKRYGFL